MPNILATKLSHYTVMVLQCIDHSRNQYSAKQQSAKGFNHQSFVYLTFSSPPGQYHTVHQIDVLLFNLKVVECFVEGSLYEYRKTVFIVGFSSY